MTPIRVLVVEDEGMVRDAFAQLLALQPDVEVVTTAQDGAEALEVARATPLDIVLTDIEMPTMSGLDLAASIRDDGLACRVVILSTFARAGYVRRAMDAGVAGYVLKAGPVRELVDALRLVRDGGRAIAPEVAVLAWDRPAELTDRQRDVLRLAADGHPNAEIAATLFLAEGTVRNYLSEAITRLGARNRAEAAAIAREQGLL